MSREETLLNEEINFKEVRCVGDNGEVYGIISSKEALNLANQAGLDLVLISPNAKPPVCKIMDYGKFRYQADINYKVKHAIEFLESGKHVKFKVFLKQRELSIPQAGMDTLHKVAAMLEDIAIAEKEPKLEGKYLNVLYVPKKKDKH